MSKCGTQRIWSRSMSLLVRTICQLELSARIKDYLEKVSRVRTQIL